MAPREGTFPFCDGTSCTSRSILARTVMRLRPPCSTPTPPRKQGTLRCLGNAHVNLLLRNGRRLRLLFDERNVRCQEEARLLILRRSGGHLAHVVIVRWIQHHERRGRERRGLTEKAAEEARAAGGLAAVRCDRNV